MLSVGLGLTRPWRSGAAGALAAYAANGITPPFVFQAVDEVYATGGTATTRDMLTVEGDGLRTFYNDTGNLVWNAHNLLAWSEDFTQPAWSRFSSGTGLLPVVVSNQGLSPDGTMTADRVTLDLDGGTTASDVSRLVQNGITLLKSKLGVWLKSFDGSTYSVLLELENNQYGPYDVTSEWQFFEAERNGLNVGSTYGIRLRGNTSSTTADLLVWGANVNDNTLPMAPNPYTGDSYVLTTDSAVYLPRYNSHVYDGSAWVKHGVRVEDKAATNLLTQSIDLSAATVIAHTAVFSSTVGGYDLYTVTRTTGGARYVGDNVTLTASTTYTLSTVASSASVSAIGLLCGDNADLDPYIDVSWNPATLVATTNSNLNMGTVVVHPAHDIGNGLYRFAVTFTPTTTTVYRAGVYAGSAGADNILAGAIQLEVGSKPSSYIPTAGSSQTRAAETAVFDSALLPYPAPAADAVELITPSILSQIQSDLSSGTVAAPEIGATIGVTYRVKIVLSGRTTGDLDTGVGSYNQGLNLTANSEIIYFQEATDTDFLIREQNGYDGSVVSLSVQEINPAVSFSMKGLVSYADNDLSQELQFLRWFVDASNQIYLRLSTNATNEGAFNAVQIAAAVFDSAGEPAPGTYAPGLNVPFSIASRHGSTFVNAAADGAAFTANTTPTTFPALSGTDMQIATTFDGHISEFIMWGLADGDIGDVGIAEASSV